MVYSLDPPKSASDVKRERDVFNLYAAFQDIPNIHNLGYSPDTHSIPSDYVPKQASDASLAAFCQLAAMRLNAARSLISLIDDKYQYILAEATPRTSLRAGSSLNKSNDLGFGNVRLPRRWGVCERVLDPLAVAEGKHGIVIINDCTKSEQHSKWSYVRDGPLRFYAGVPLVTESGSVVGAVCILDDVVRDGLAEDDIQYLQDLAVTVMEYLVTYTVKDRYRRAAEGLNGLMSFAEGSSASTLKAVSTEDQAIDQAKNEANDQAKDRTIEESREAKEAAQEGEVSQPGYEAKPDTTESCEGESTKQSSLKDDGLGEAPAKPQLDTTEPLLSPPLQCVKPAASSRARSDRRHTLSELQESLLPMTTKELFARAAEIMRQSNDMSGVMFIDASYAATGMQGTQPADAEKHCKILGFATSERSSMRGDFLPSEMTPKEYNLRLVLEQYPHGYTLSCDGSEDESHDAPRPTPNEPVSDTTDDWQQDKELPIADKDRARHRARMKALIPNIKSALFLPLCILSHLRGPVLCLTHGIAGLHCAGSVSYPMSSMLTLSNIGDFERGRWFAGCFCWSTRAERVLDGRLDLPFLKAFGHSIMQEVARLDAMSTSQAKTTFLSSLSHELRTPLHGILGSVHLMRNSPLDSFQASMVNSITICGRTLLETVEHLLDHAERPESSRKHTAIVTCGDSTISIACEKALIDELPEESSESSKCNVGFVTEEVVETMIIGEAPFNITLDANDDGDTSVDQTSRQAIAKKRSRFIILDISGYEGLGFRLSASSYGRLVMNLFGNALKFTESGYIHISVRAENHTEKEGFVVLKISDTGIGMNSRFLEKAFEPFRKQSQHTAGTGVGLSVVKRILEDVGGRIEVSSTPSVGTDIVLKLPLERLIEEEGNDIKINPLPVAMSGLKGRRACILYAGSDPSDAPEIVQHKKTMLHYVEVLTATLSNVLQLELYHTSVWDGSDDTEIVICPEVSFESIQAIRTSAAKSGRRCPATVLIAMDILEAETLRCDARVMSKEFIVESVTQPCGPYKISVVLSSCLQLYDAANRPSTPKTPTDTNPTSRISPILSSNRVNEFGPRLGLYPPALAMRTKSASPGFVQLAVASVVQAQSSTSTADTPFDPHVQHTLIVDDNPINRRLLSAWMKRHKIPYKEAKDGQQALDAYKESPQTALPLSKFDLILMDISMPVMDGMTSTRLIREHEKKNGWTPCHIIALTGLTSASAKLEAWTSGVDDFLTKPLDFKKLGTLMEVGRGGAGTGFLKEQGSMKTREAAKGMEEGAS